jgi:SsrA-binding protein
LIHKVIALNKLAKFDYNLTETVEAGIVLTGFEVKAARLGGVSIRESHIGEMQGSGELYLFNANFPEYVHAAHMKQEPKRPRKLLLGRRQINKFLGQVHRKGFTIIPVQMYFNERGIIKIEIALAQGKNVVDKRETIKQREWDREKHRVLKRV